MPGKLLELARKDAKTHLTTGGFEENITIQAANGFTVQVKGFASKHHLNFNSDGLPINAKNVHICISESDLINLAYPVRNAKNEVNLLNNIITFKDSTGSERVYKINENYPDEALGLIVCILSDNI